MKLRKLFMMCLVVVTMMVGLGTISQAVEVEQKYQITDNYVVIDSVSYEVVNNTINYDGKIFEIRGDALISFDENGEETILILPLEDNRITDPKKLAALNSKIRRAIPLYPQNLPYSAVVPKGQWYTETPVVNLIHNQFYYYTKVQISGMPIFADKRFAVGFILGDIEGNWYESQFVNEWDFQFSPTLKFYNVSSTRYAMFNFACLYGNPTPSYTYTISVSNNA